MSTSVFEIDTDTYLDSRSASTSYATDAELRMGFIASTGAERRVLLLSDLAVIPNSGPRLPAALTGVLVNSATLTLEVRSSGGSSIGGGQTAGAFRVTDTTASSGATWNVPTAGSSYDWAGGANSLDTASASFFPLPTAPGNLEIDVTGPIAAQFAAGVADLRLLLAYTTPTSIDDEVRFWSQDSGTVTTVPQVAIDWTLDDVPPGSGTAVGPLINRGGRFISNVGGRLTGTY